MSPDVNPIAKTRHGTILLLLAHLFFLSCLVEGQTLKRPSNDAVPTPIEILDAADQAMGTAHARENIRSISAIAACHGPRGEYETRIISERDGNLSFQQFFPDHKNIAGILNNRGWQLDDNGRREWIDAAETYILRGHEFPVIALDLRKRFHDFRTVGIAQFKGHATTQIAMTDELGHPANAYFSLASHLLVGLTVTSPRTGAPGPVTIQIDSWRITSGVNLVSYVTILYGSDTFTFDFKSLSLNTVDDKVFQIPEGLPASSESK